MNDEIKQHIRNAIRSGIRLDGRKPLEIRPIKIQTRFISTAEGSARVKFGDAEVIAGVKMAQEKPYPDTPEDGVLMVNSELLPLSHPDFESGPPSIESIETARVIDRGIRESKALDTKKLCITKGEKVWTIAIDVVPINYDGNLIDMGGLAAVLALKTATMPEVVNGVINYHKKSNTKLELKSIPIPITIGKIGEIYIVDPTSEEEKALDGRLTITTLDDEKLCAMQKGGNAPLTQKDIDRMVEIAFEKAAELRKKVLEVK